MKTENWAVLALICSLGAAPCLVSAASVSRAPAQTLGAAGTAGSAGAEEMNALSRLNAIDPGLLRQGAGDELYMRDDGRRHGRRAYSYGIGGLVLTVIGAAALVVALR